MFLYELDYPQMKMSFQQWDSQALKLGTKSWRTGIKF